MRRIGLLVSLLLAAGAQVAPAQSPPSAPSAEGSRVALLIGNANYAVAPLKSPVSDIREVAGALGALGFTVTKLENARQRDMREALRSFVLGARAAEVRLFYFAGHGFQMRGRNYLIPIDARIQNESDILKTTADASELIHELAAIRTGANVVIIDASRDLPIFEPGLRRALAARPGLTQAVPPAGSVIAFSAQPGVLTGDTSVYTQHLVRAMREAPGLPIEAFFKRVRSGVAAATQFAQVPWEASDMTGELCLRPGAAGECKP